jgi:O-antigen ligase
VARGGTKSLYNGSMATPDPTPPPPGRFETLDAARRLASGGEWRLLLGQVTLAAAAAVLLGVLLGVVGPLYVGLAAGAVVVIALATAAPEKAIILVPLSIYLPVRESISATVNVGAADVLLALIAVGWALWGLRRSSMPLERDPTYLLGLVYVGSAALSLVNSPSAALTFIGLLRAFEVFLLLFVIVGSVCRKTEALRWLLGVFVLVAGFEAVVGLFQFLTGTGAWVEGSYSRAIGTVNIFNWLDLAVALACATCLVVADILVRRHGEWWRYPLLLLLGAGIVATYTRGVWLTLILALSLMIVGRKPQAIVPLVLILVLGLGVVAANPQSDLSKRVISISDPADPSVVQRLYLWQTAINIFKAHPLVGIGAKTFHLARDRYAVPGLEIYSYHDSAGGGGVKAELLGPHEFYLLTAAERGLVGLVSFVGLIGFLLARGILTARRARAPELSAAALGLSGALLFMAMHSLVADLFAGSFLPAGAFLLACLAAAAQIQAREGQPDTVTAGR